MVRESTQVVVVGAGPVGLTAALRLGLAGISCIVIEREPALPEDLRASTFHPPTLDMLSPYGLDKALIDEGLLCPTWQIRIHETGERALFDLSVIAEDTAHPFRLQCEQFRLTRLLYEQLKAIPNVEIRLDVTLTGLEQDEDGVRAAWSSGRGEEGVIAAKLLVGADGARSVVRKICEFGFEGKTYPETTILATTTFRFEDHLPGLSNVNYVWTDGGTFSLLRLKDFWRCSLYPEEGETVEQALEPDSIERKLQRIVPSATPYDKLQWRPYRVHMRIVDDYRRGRVVLAGDAAHINSPSGGMGMNGGVHDAFSLTEEIPAVLADGDLRPLDRYTRRRRPIALNEILSQADRNRARMQERDPVKRREIFEGLQAMLADREEARKYLLRASMIDGLRKAAAVE
jgi:3-(3-hydroxy-phenyl)propionate hydroxylase